jgi:TolB-like protein
LKMECWRSAMRMLGRLCLIICTVVASGSAQDHGLSELASSLISQIKARAKGPVAVTSFVNTQGDTYCSTFSNYLVDRLNILLVKHDTEFVVVTRDRVEEVFKEINLALAKNYDASTFAKVGRHLGAKALIRGRYTIQQQGATISVAAQLIDVESGRIAGGDVEEIPLSTDIQTLLEGPTCGDDSRSGSRDGASPGKAGLAANKQGAESTASNNIEIPFQSSAWIYWQQLRASVVRIRSYNGLTAITFKIDGSSNSDPYRWIPAPMQTAAHDFYTANTNIIDQNGRRYRLMDDSVDLPEQPKYSNGNYVLAPHESIFVTYAFEPLGPAAHKLKITFPEIIKDGNLDVGRVTILVGLQ